MAFFFFFFFNTKNGSNDRLFIRIQTPSLQNFGVIPFVKLQNYGEKNDEKLDEKRNNFFFGSPILFFCPVLGIFLFCFVLFVFVF